MLEPIGAAVGVQASALEPRLADWPGHLTPNFSAWQEGDIILVGQDTSLLGQSLSVAQAVSLKASVRAAHQWTHAALYVGQGQIVEAVPDLGVTVASVWKYCSHRDLRVRRLSAPFTVADGQAAAHYAHQMVGQPYSMQEILLSKLLPRTEPDPKHLYCSTFVGFTINAATGYSLYARPQFRPLHPAVLASHPDMEDVMTEWCHF